MSDLPEDPIETEEPVEPAPHELDPAVWWAAASDV